MRKNAIIITACLLAVLMIGTAFADTFDSNTEDFDESAMFLEELRERIVPIFDDTGLSIARCRNYPEVAEQIDSLNALSEQFETNCINASGVVLRYLKQVDPNASAYAYEYDLKLNWKMLGTLLFTYHEKITEVLRKNLDYQIRYRPGHVCTMVIAFSDFDDLLWLDNESDWFAARNTYYYLNTVYDNNGRERRSTGFVMPMQKILSLAFPLDAKWYTRIKTTWFRSRDKGIRRHTGMDIRCALGSPIYACEGGIVNSVGYHVKGGYYVAVMDDDGYEYFYYHMKKDSQCVVRGQRIETGDQIGLSGNTGNSAAPHLHLAVITPERRFIDPFHIYYRWVYFKTGMLVKKPK